MKKILVFFAAMAITTICFAQTEDIKPKDKGEMKFENTRHNFGIFSQDTAVVSHEFVFTNVGKAPLIIHQASASCGCTVPEYTLEPIMPGEKGKLIVTYNGKGRRPGVFRKSITIHNNGRQSPIRVYIEGEMIASEKAIQPVEIFQDSTLYISDHE